VQRVIRGALPFALAELPDAHVEAAGQVEVPSWVGTPGRGEDAKAELVTTWLVRWGGGGGRRDGIGGRCEGGGGFQYARGGG
jgi:hypothetical protein